MTLQLSRDARVNALICSGHTLSHFYILCLPTMFIAWQKAFDVPFAVLGISIAVMSGTTAIVQTPIGFLVDRFGARRFLIGGTLAMTLSIAAMGLATRSGRSSHWRCCRGSATRCSTRPITRSSPGRSSREDGPLVCAAHLYRPCRLCQRATGDRGADLAVRVAQTLLLVGLVGIPVVLAIVWQSRILADQKRTARPSGAGPARSACCFPARSSCSSASS